MGPSVPRWSQIRHTNFRVLWQGSWIVATMWTFWSKILLASSLGSRSWTMASRICNLVTICCTFSRLADDRGMSSRYRPSSASWSVIASMWTCRRVWKKAFRGRCCFPSMSARICIGVTWCCVRLGNDRGKVEVSTECLVRQPRLLQGLPAGMSVGGGPNRAFA